MDVLVPSSLLLKEISHIKKNFTCVHNICIFNGPLIDLYLRLSLGICMGFTLPTNCMKVMRHLLIEHVLYMPKIMLFEIKISDYVFFGRAHAKNASLFYTNWKFDFVLFCFYFVLTYMYSNTFLGLRYI